MYGLLRMFSLELTAILNFGRIIVAHIKFDIFVNVLHYPVAYVLSQFSLHFGKSVLSF